MTFVSIVALLVLIEYLTIAFMTGRAREAYDVEAPATTGHPMFERWYRVQQNTLEQLVVFLPALFLFAHFASERLAGWLGLVFIVGRFVYARSYLADPKTRSAGFIIGFAATAILVVGALLAAVF
jgi:glutathione S-transferase